METGLFPFIGQNILQTTQLLNACRAFIYSFGGSGGEPCLVVINICVVVKIRGDVILSASSTSVFTTIASAATSQKGGLCTEGGAGAFLGASRGDPNGIVEVNVSVVARSGSLEADGVDEELAADGVRKQAPPSLTSMDKLINAYGVDIEELSIQAR